VQEILKEPIVDTIVVGSGPAGSQCAYNLSSRGHSVILLDYRENIGDKLCTGIVSAEFEKFYPDVSKFIYRRAYSASIFSPSGKLLKIKRKSPQALIIDRESFIREIAFNAEKLDTKLKLGRVVEKIEVNSKFVQVRVKYNGEVEEYTSRSLVLASGFGSRLAKMVGLDTPKTKIFGAQVKIKFNGIDEVNVFTGHSLPKGFFGWMVPLNNNYSYLGILGKENPKEIFEDFCRNLKNRFTTLSFSDDVDIWGIPVSPSSKIFSNRIVGIGDVVGQVKPTTGGGIYFSMRSADLASQVLSEGLLSNNLSETFLSNYQKSWEKIFKKELQVGQLARFFYESLSEDEINNIINYLFESGVLDKEISFDWHSELVMYAFKTKILNFVKTPMRKAVQKVIYSLNN
jgi:geranylgeranyl reductase family protein